MDVELKTRWLTALRSGDYKQTKGKLRNVKGFCCLGVLGNLIDPTRWVPTDLDDTGEAEGIQTWGTFDRDTDEHDPECYLPYNIIDYGVQCDLSTMNDEGATFADIADEIEREL